MKIRVEGRGTAFPVLQRLARNILATSVDLKHLNRDLFTISGLCLCAFSLNLSILDLNQPVTLLISFRMPIVACIQP